MTASAGTTTIEVPIPLRERLGNLKAHARQPYHEVVAKALDALEGREVRGLDSLVAQHRVALRVAAQRNGLSRIWLFGSRARGTGKPTSDVDILYQAKPGVGLWEACAFMADAEDILGAKVDILDMDGLSPRMRKNTLPDAVPI